MDNMVKTLVCTGLKLGKNSI